MRHYSHFYTGAGGKYVGLTDRLPVSHTGYWKGSALRNETGLIFKTLSPREREGPGTESK